MPNSDINLPNMSRNPPHSNNHEPQLKLLIKLVQFSAIFY